ncbi:MAG: hypothetical protein ACOH2V_13590 [Candidatus Saccharimonadaceae bacterium]
MPEEDPNSSDIKSELDSNENINGSETEIKKKGKNEKNIDCPGL